MKKLTAQKFIKWCKKFGLAENYGAFILFVKYVDAGGKLRN